MFRQSKKNKIKLKLKFILKIDSFFCFSGQYMLSGGVDKIVRMWDLHKHGLFVFFIINVVLKTKFEIFLNKNIYSIIGYISRT